MATSARVILVSARADTTIAVPARADTTLSLSASL